MGFIGGREVATGVYPVDETPTSPPDGLGHAEAAVEIAAAHWDAMKVKSTTNKRRGELGFPGYIDPTKGICSEPETPNPAGVVVANARCEHATELSTFNVSPLAFSQNPDDNPLGLHCPLRAIQDDLVKS